MVLIVNGVDLTPYIASQGLKWQRNDVDGPDAGRTMDALMHRERVSTKIRLDITCRPMTSAEARVVLQTIYPEYVTVRYTDPMIGDTTKTMYSNNNPATFYCLRSNGEEVWTGITFPLIER